MVSFDENNETPNAILGLLTIKITIPPPTIKPIIIPLWETQTASTDKSMRRQSTGMNTIIIYCSSGYCITLDLENGFNVKNHAKI